MKLFMYSVFLLLLAPCNASKKTASSEGNNKDLKTVVIIYEKTPCFGSCPTFTMTIKGDDLSMVYKGKQNVSKKGEYHKTIREGELKGLMDAFAKAKFFELQDSYDGQVTDLPSTYVTYTLNGKTKKVKDRYKAPGELKDLEKALDDIQTKEDQEGRSFTEEPEIMAVPERSLLIQDGITNKGVRIITFLAITRHQGDDYFSTILGSIPDDALLTAAFIQSVFETWKSLESCQ